jgi:hypothetical protein
MENEYLKIQFWRLQDCCRFFEDVYRCTFYKENKLGICDINRCPVWKWIKDDQPK